MNVVLEKDGQKFDYKAGSAIYLLFGIIPVIGGIVGLVLAIINKQFRGVYLNMFLVGLIMMVGMILVVLTGSQTLVTIFYILYMAFSYYMIIMYVLHANEYSVKQRLAEGYVVTNINEAEVQAFVEKAQNTKSQFWQLTKF